MNIVLILCLIFVLQSALSIMQLRYYQRHMNKLAEHYSKPGDAKYYLYSSMEKKKFAVSAAIALIIVDEKSNVKECQVFEGRSIFSKFKEIPQFKHQTLQQLQQHFALEQSGRKLFLWEKAVIKTMNQISGA